MLNPYICPIDGDLSRADTVVLTQLCRNKHVIEYGVGGSTVLLAQVAKSVLSYETKPVWAERAREQLAEVSNKTCEPIIHIIGEKHDGSSVEGIGRQCDVLFSDGWAAMRGAFVVEFWPYIRDCAITHDTRATYAANVVKHFFNSFLPTDKSVNIWGHPYSASLRTIEWNYMESNMCVLFKRNCELLWEDWKKTEAGNNRQGWGQ